MSGIVNAVEIVIEACNLLTQGPCCVAMRLASILIVNVVYSKSFFGSLIKSVEDFSTKFFFRAPRSQILCRNR